MAYYIDPGEISNGLSFSSSIMYVSCGGIANSTTIRRSSYIHVSSGGTINYTSTQSNCRIYLSSGAAANNTSIGQSCYMYVSSGGNINDTVVEGLFPGASVILSSGATANRTTLYNSGSLCVAGSANSNFVSGGKLHVSNGGIAVNNTIHAGAIHVSSGGVASTTVQSDGGMYISSGGTARNNTVYKGFGSVFSGGLLIDTHIAGAADFRIFNGGTMRNTTVGGNGDIMVYSGGNLENVTLNYAGTAYVSKGGMLSNGTVSSGGKLTLYGTAKNLTVYAGADIYANRGANLELAYSPWEITGSIYCPYTMLARERKVYLGGAIGLVSKTDSAAYWDVTSGLSAIVFSGGKANYTTIHSGGYAYNLGGSMLGLTLKNGGRAYISKGSVADTLYISQGGNAYVWSGGTAKNAYTQSFGCLYVYDGGVASSTKLMTNGNLYIYSGGKAFDTVTSYGVKIYMFGGSMSKLNMQRGTIVSAYKGANVVSTTVDYGSYLMFGYSGNNCTGVASATNTTVLGGGGLTVITGAKATDITLAVNGTLTCNNNATIGGLITNAGRMNLAGNAIIVDNSNIIFDLAGKSASAMVESYKEAMLNSYYVARNANMLITVSANQSAGSYILANWAGAAKGKFISLTVGSTKVGYLSIGNSITHNGKKYSLYNFDDATKSKALILTVQKINASAGDLMDDPDTLPDLSLPELPEASSASELTAESLCTDSCAPTIAAAPTLDDLFTKTTTQLPLLAV